MRRLRGQEGFAVPLAIAVIAIVAGFSAVAIALATHNVERSSRDRNSVRALAAADAGLDTAAYRLNKLLIASRVDGLVPDAYETLIDESLGCLDVAVGTLAVAYVEINGCTATEPETLDQTVNEDGLGQPATYRYWVKSDVDLGTGDSLVKRRIVVVGEVGGIVRRVVGTYQLDLAAPATNLFQRESYVECTATVPESGTDPADGC